MPRRPYSAKFDDMVESDIEVLPYSGPKEWRLKLIRVNEVNGTSAD